LIPFLKNRSIYILIFALCFLAEYLFPQQSKLSKSVNNISEFIASGEFLILKEQVGGLSIVDSIYSQALKVNDNDHSEALLSLIFATVPYNYQIHSQFSLNCCIGFNFQAEECKSTGIYILR